MRAIDGHHSRTWSPQYTHMVATILVNGRRHEIENFDKNYEKDNKQQYYHLQSIDKLSQHDDTDKTDGRALHLRWYCESNESVESRVICWK